MDPMGNSEVKPPKAGMILIWVTFMTLDHWCKTCAPDRSGSYTTRKICDWINTKSTENFWSWLLFQSRWPGH